MISDINNETPGQEQAMPAIPQVVDYIETEGGLFCSLYSDNTFRIDWSMGEDEAPMGEWMNEISVPETIEHEGTTYVLDGIVGYHVETEGGRAFTLHHDKTARIDWDCEGSHKDESAVAAAIEHDGVTYAVTGPVEYFKAESGLVYELCLDKTAHVDGGEVENGTGTLAIPESVERNGVTYTVKGIFVQALQEDYDYEALVLPDTIEFIDDVCFGGFDKLKRITLPSGISPDRIGTDLLYCLAHAEEVVIGGIAYPMKEGMMQSPDGAPLPEAVRQLADAIFNECSNPAPAVPSPACPGLDDDLPF